MASTWYVTRQEAEELLGLTPEQLLERGVQEGRHGQREQDQSADQGVPPPGGIIGRHLGTDAGEQGRPPGPARIAPDHPSQGIDGKRDGGI